MSPMQAVPAFEVGPGWALPDTVPAFLEWLREAIPDARDDAERLRIFTLCPASANAPEAIRLLLLS